MTQKSKEKTRARALQANTGWSYQYCLNCVHTMTEEQIDARVREKGADLADDVPDPDPGNDDPNDMVPTRDWGDL